MLSSSEREVWAKEEGPGVNVRRGEGPGRGTVLGCLCERLADPLPRHFQFSVLIEDLLCLRNLRRVLEGSGFRAGLGFVDEVSLSRDLREAEMLRARRRQ